MNTGTRTLVPPIEGLRNIKFLDAGNWLRRADLPNHLAIIGGGYIGLEMAQLYRRMGSKVTVIQRGHQITDREDPDVPKALQKILEAEGIKFHLSAEVKRVATTDGGVRLRVAQNGTEQDLEASHVFVAVGRKPNTDDLGLETIGVKTDERGYAQVDTRLATIEQVSGRRATYAAGRSSRIPSVVPAEHSTLMGFSPSHLIKGIQNALEYGTFAACSPVLFRMVPCG